jgi:hypothetical protein
MQPDSCDSTLVKIVHPSKLYGQAVNACCEGNTSVFVLAESGIPRPSIPAINQFRYPSRIGISLGRDAKGD